jgi:outer membrane protein assembly factor BamB
LTQAALILLLVKEGEAFCCRRELDGSTSSAKPREAELKSLLVPLVFVLTASLSGQTPTDGLVAYYPFNGNANDESGNGNNGTVNGATLTTDRCGNPDRAYRFNGHGDYIDCGNRAPLNITGSISIALWLYADTIDYNFHGIASKKNSPGNQTYNLQTDSSHSTHVINSIRWGGVGPDLFSPAIDAGSWHFVVAIFSSETQMKYVYMDGALTDSISTSPISAFLVSNDNLLLGTVAPAYVPGWSWNGKLDEIRIYNRVLSDSEVSALYHDSNPNLTVLALNHSVNLQWDAVPGKNYLRYRIYRGQSAPATAVYDSVSGSTLTYTDGSLVDGITYHYKVAGVDSNLVESAISQEVTAIPRLQQSASIVLSGAGGPITGLSLMSDSSLYAIASGDAVYRLNKSGYVDYTLQVGGIVNSCSSISSDAVVYIASSDKNVYSFSNSGTSTWPPLPLGGVMSTTPAIDETGGLIYVGIENKNFVAIDRTTGKVTWNFFTDAPIRSSAVITADRLLVFSTVVGTINALDLNNSIGGIPQRYILSAGDSIIGSPAIDPQGAIYFPALHGKSVKVRVGRGSGISMSWQQQNGPAVSASLLIDGRGTLFMASLDSSLYAIDTATGFVKWSHKTAGAIRTTPTISTLGIIYLGNTKGEVIALDASGVEQWYYKDSAAIVAPLLYDGGMLFAGTSSGKVLALNDASLSSNKSLANGSPAWLTFQGSNRRTGNQSDEAILSVSTRSPQSAMAYILDQNYPNPFNPSTTIRYGLPHQSEVSLTVFNMLGQQVRTLVNETQDAGYHALRFDGTNLASGVYFCRIQAGSFVQTKRLLLLK